MTFFAVINVAVYKSRHNLMKTSAKVNRVKAVFFQKNTVFFNWGPPTTARPPYKISEIFLLGRKA